MANDQSNRSLKTPLRIVHLPEVVGGHAVALSQEERKIGLESRVINLYKNKYFEYDFVKNIIESEKKSLISRLIKHFEIFWETRISDVDVIHFNYGSSLLNFPSWQMPLLDVPFYPSHATKVWTYSGCDARQKYPTIQRNRRLNTPCACSFHECYAGMCNSGKLDNFRRKSIEKALKFAKKILCLNPDLLNFFPRGSAEFIPYCVYGIMNAEKTETILSKKDKIRIVHAPTQRVTKGTHIILNGIRELQKDFPGVIDFRLVENMPREDVIEIYKTADLLIDQLLIGWYGTVAVEAMSLGIPVAVYINPDNFQFLEKEFVAELPFFNIHPDTFFKDLRDIIKNREILSEYSEKSFAFVRKWHSPESICKKIVKYYY
jgi:glycosyltransferase involved in cell wall biosynthesis